MPDLSHWTGLDGQPIETPIELVNDAHHKFFGQIDTLLAMGNSYMAQLAAFVPTQTAFNVPFNFNGQITPFQRPTTPTFNADDYNVTTPDLPQLPGEFVPGTVDIGVMPEFTDIAPTFAFGPKPVAPNLQRPIAPATPTLPVMPATPDLTSMAPPPVTLLSLNIPTLPALDLPLFQVDKPARLQAFGINDSYEFMPTKYASDLLDQTKAKISLLMQGREALPAAIERILFDRGRSRITVETQAQVDQVYDDYGARGFSAPSGLLAARIDAVRQKGQDQIAEFNRDATQKSFDEALANMRLAVSSGIQLEGVTINLHIEEQKLLLASVAHSRDTAIAVLNARIAQYNAELAGAQLDLSLIEGQLKVELSKLDVLRGQLEAEKLKGDMNAQTVALYQAQWQAVKTVAEVYSSQVDAYKTQAEAAKIPIEIFSEQTRAFSAMYDAYAKEWDGYRSSVEGETARGTLYRTMVDAFGAKVDATVKRGGLAMDSERLRIQQHGQLLDQYKARLDAVNELLRVQEAKLSAVAQRDRARADVFRAQADIETAASAAADRQFQSGLQAAIAQKDTQMENARIKSQENIALQNMMMEKLRALAQMLSQLLASTMSAVNHSISASASDGFSRSASVGWSGEANDYSGQIL